MNTEIIENQVENEDINKTSEELFNLGLKKLESYNLEWTFRSIRYILNKENTSFGQLRSCVYIQDGQGVFDYIRSVLLLIKAGLVGSKQFSEADSKLEDKAYDIMEDWRENFGSISSLHLLIIYIMEQKHFFIGNQDQTVMTVLSSRNLETDLISNIKMEDLEEKIKQLQALSETL